MEKTEIAQILIQSLIKKDYSVWTPNDNIKVPENPVQEDFLSVIDRIDSAILNKINNLYKNLYKNLYCC